MDPQIAKQVKRLAEVYGPEAIWQNAVLLIEARYGETPALSVQRSAVLAFDAGWFAKITWRRKGKD